ncbi:hypothetical protein [Hymenobacter glacieicola]|uniref:PepSY domain-containing protein n=1 Tax=Hymenobacter glacieicola TaxID=1562124 RepID=A0ABQ1WMS8_9BACT|nr:hypothetical protein [Hymenobacter glacieicola]GGG37467.1 hypothetical protein GCM10011378_12230 [Hymenobacter glacieicola]
MRYLFLTTFALVSLVSTGAQAQLESTSPAQQRAANRRALREAAQFQGEYKESHLTVTKAELKHAGSGRQAAAKPTDGRASYQFDRTGTPRVTEPSRASFRLRKKKESSSQ